MQGSIIRKKEKLASNLKELGALIIAFSGGVDSTFLLAMAHKILGDKVIAATASSVIHPSRETDNSTAFTSKRGIRHIVFETGEMKEPAFIGNNPDRCYHCKQHMLQLLSKIAEEQDIEYIAHGANTDDLSDFRPGAKAAEEAGVIAPLADAQLTKDEIRLLSKEMGLSTWDTPSNACLATRIPYGDIITEKKLKVVEEAEIFLFDQGFKEVRVRHHGSVARIESGKTELNRFTDEEFRALTVKKFREIGYSHIALDLEGYVSGKMNR